MKAPVGTSLLVIGTLHTLFAFVPFGTLLGEIVADGVFQAAEGAERGQAFWFLIAGPLFMLFGVSTRRLEEAELALPRSLGWGLLAVAVLGVVVKPVSGFWLLLLPGVLAVRGMPEEA
ncbi:MAG: DUF6463 family protein [Myxococcota bacterium]